jgi:serine/threonine protein kinase
MPIPATGPALVDLCRRCGVVDLQRLESYLTNERATAALAEGPAPLADLLVREGMLTSFQAQHLLQGKHRGFLLGKYKLLELLGPAGVGQVFLGEHQTTGERVAIQVLPAESWVALEQSQQKARAALAHPNLVRIRALARDGKRHFLVMEHIEGVSLAALVQKTGPLPVARAAHYVGQVAAALEHIHQAGMVHRDIEPANLLLDRAGTIKVFGLGLAHLRREGPTRGTTDYRAPEQVAGSPTVDIRADIFGLGMTFSFLLTGEAPLHGASPAHPRRSGLPAEIVATVERMLAPAPRDRYQAPSDVLVALFPWTQGAPPPPTEAELPARSPAAPRSVSPSLLLPPSPASAQTPAAPRAPSRVLAAAPNPTIQHAPQPETVKRQALPGGPMPVVRLPSRRSPADTRRRRQLVLVGIGLTFLVSAGIVLGLWLRRATRPSPPVAQAPTEERPPEKPPGERPRPAPVPPPPGRLLRDDALVYEGHTGAVESVAISRDGRLVLSGSHDGTARVWDLGLSRELNGLLGHTGWVWFVAFHPDSRHALTSGGDGTIRLWDTVNGQELRQFHGHRGPVHAVAFSPDGKQAVSGGSDGTIRLWNVDTGQQARQFPGHRGGAQSVVFTPDGGRLLSGGNDNLLRLWDVSSGKELRKFSGHTAAVRRVACSLNGRWAASGSFDGTARLWDIDKGEEVRQFPGHTTFVESVCFSPDNRLLLTTEGPTLEGQLVTQDQGVRVWEVVTGRQLHRFGNVLGKVHQAVFSPDGQHIVAGCGDHNVLVFDVAKAPALAAPKDAKEPGEE